MATPARGGVRESRLSFLGRNEAEPFPEVTCTPGWRSNHRYYRKYPMRKFPRLGGYVADNFALETRIRDRKRRRYYDVYRLRAPRERRAR